LDLLLLLILFSLVPCTGSKECWRLATNGEGDRLLLRVAGLWALLKTGWRRLRRRQLGLPPCSVWGKKGTVAGLCFFYGGK